MVKPWLGPFKKKLAWLALAGLLLISCGIVFQSTTVIKSDETTIVTLDISIDKVFLLEQSINQLWQQQMQGMTAYLQGRGAAVQSVDTAQQSGLQATIAFDNLLALNTALSGDDLSLFESFTLERWRGEYVFEARTTSALIRQRIQEITGLSSEEIFLVQFPLNIRLQMPGELIRTNAAAVDAAGMQTWQIPWLLDETHLMYANARVPLIPPVITEPADGARIRDASAGVDFAGTGEPGADLRLFRVEGENQRTLLASGQVGRDGNWRLPGVSLGPPGMYRFQVQESTDHETLLSAQADLEHRPREPIVFVPGYYACTEGIFGTQINWHWGLYPSRDPGWETTGLIPGVTILYYGPLFRYFHAQGYTLGDDLFVACYDWTASLPVEAGKLSEVLDWARAYNTAALPLTVITHSNGGLITRYQIQDDPQRTYNQISDVIMIAPPNHGVVKAYYGWEGGDISKEGTMLESLISITIWRQCGIRHPVPGLPGYDRRMLNYQKDVYNCLRYGKLISPLVFDLGTARDDEIVSLGWLLPGCQNAANCSFWSYPDAPVQRLNQPAQIDALFKGIQGNVYILTGNTGNATLGRIPFIARSPDHNPLWKNGKPDPAQAPVMQAGDGTVLLESSWLPEAERFTGRYFAYPPYQGADHAKGMVQRPGILTDISAIIRENLPEGRERVNASSDMIVIWVESPVNLLVTAPDGRRAGVDASGIEINEIPDSAYGDTGDPLGPKFIILSNPPGGQYAFSVTGVADGEYKLNGISSASPVPFLAEEGQIRQNETRTYKEDYTPPAAEVEDGSGSSPLADNESARRAQRRALAVICPAAIVLVGVIVVAILARRRGQRNQDPYGSGWDQVDPYGGEKKTRRRKKGKQGGPDDYDW